MAIDYFERMVGARVGSVTRDFALDHYAPHRPRNGRVSRSRARIRAAIRHRAPRSGAGISHQIAVERGRVLSGISSSAPIVTRDGRCARRFPRTGVGSSAIARDITGKVWLRVPHTIKVELEGERRPSGVTAKDIASRWSPSWGGGRQLQNWKFHGDALGAFTLEGAAGRLESRRRGGAKAAIFPVDDTTRRIWPQDVRRQPAVTADLDARYARTSSSISRGRKPVVALRTLPKNVTSLSRAWHAGAHVFLGTCTADASPIFIPRSRVLERAGGRVARRPARRNAGVARGCSFRLNGGRHAREAGGDGRGNHDARLRRLLRHERRIPETE